jgi:hypothetical protein
LVDENVDPEYQKLSACGHIAHCACYLEWFFSKFYLNFLVHKGSEMKDKQIVQNAIKNWKKIANYVTRKWPMASGMSIVIAKLVRTQTKLRRGKNYLLDYIFYDLK